MPFRERYAKALCLAGILLAGILITSPNWNFEGPLAQGDHGRDLYAAEAVYRGELPYRDFWWVYGPLMPYYYGLFYKVFGTHISSIIVGKLIIRIAGGLLVGLAMMEITSVTAAFLCACWFLLFQNGFFFTYNHLGGVVMDLGVILCLISYIKTNSLRAAWSALGFAFVLCLIKINFGAAALLVVLLTIAVCDALQRVPLKASKVSFYAAAIVGLPLVVFAIYWYLLHGLSVMEIRQCLPYKEGDQPYSTTPWHAISLQAQNTLTTIKTSWRDLIFAMVINASAVRCIFVFARKELAPARRKILLLSFGMLLFLYVINTHEFIKSGVWYRYYWAQPMSMMIFFMFIDGAAQSFNKTVRKVIFVLVAVLGLQFWFTNMQLVNSTKIQTQWLPFERGGVYVANPTQWISTVEQTVAFLKGTLKDDELFFALPYDCIYYYLTGKRTPTRQLIFFEHIKIPPEQERSVIADLERNHVNTILLSNRAFARMEPGLGFLGTSYCPLIGKYISENFTTIARFGDWSHEPGWAWNHGTMILRRKGT